MSGRSRAVQLGADITGRRVQVNIGSVRFTVVGVLAPVPLVGDLDRDAFIGYPEATDLAGEEPLPTTIYVRARPDVVTDAPGEAAGEYGTRCRRSD